MDLLAIVRAIQAVSGEVVLDTILEKMLGILIDASRAEHGALLIVEEEGLSVRATGHRPADAEAATMTVAADDGLDPEQACAPLALAGRVAAGAGPQVFADVRGHPDVLEADPCLADRGARSFICLPIQRHQSVVGVACLGCTDRTDVFTPETVELLELLSAQVAVSLENVGLFDDLWNEVTERKRVEDSLRELNEQLERRVEERTLELEAANVALARSNAELEEFAYAASHDLQEPLRVISGFSALIGSKYGDRLDDAGRTYVDHMSSAATRMRRLVSDLLDYSRLTTRHAPPTAVDLNAILDDVWQNLAAAVEESGALLTRDEELPQVVADRSQFMRLLQNLMGNAIKYRGEDDPWVHVSGRRQGDEWVFGVADNGIGIAPDHHDSVFNIFRRLHRIDEYPGTGIGLASVKKIVERHGGRVWVDSTPGDGSTFWFTWPVTSEDSLPAVVVRRSETDERPVALPAAPAAD